MTVLANTEETLLPQLDQPIQLPVFEGPLDLLLFLIRKNEIDIYDIPIQKVTKQYLSVIYALEEMNLGLAGEFFVMASTLMYIKSRMLLPKNEQAPEEDIPEEELDPRWELVEQLLQYKKFKETTADLRQLIDEHQNILPRECKKTVAEMEARPLKKSDKMEIWGAFNRVLRHFLETRVSGEIHEEPVTLADRMEYVVTMLEEKERFMLSNLIPEQSSINFIVSTFLALLELARLKKMTIEQNDVFTDIECVRLDGVSLADEDSVVDESEK